MSIEKMKHIFAAFFIVAQQWKNIGDRYLSNDNLTTMQWLLMTVLSNELSSSPTLSEAASAMGTSRQNVKQIALKLQSLAYLSLDTDAHDKRIQRLNLTDKSNEFWKKRLSRDNANFSVLFTGLTAEEINLLFTIVSKLEKQTKIMNRR